MDKNQLLNVGLKAATELLDVPRRIVTRERRTAPDHHTVIPEATYSPWAVDDEFKRAADAVSSHTLVNRHKLYELWSLAGQVARIPGDYLEVGVWRGGSAALVATRFKQTGATDHQIILCDTFTGVALAGEHDATYQGGEHSDTSITIVESLFKDCKLPAPTIHVGIFPRDTGQYVATNRFSLVHIDVDVYESAMLATEAVWEQVSPGGVVVFDDYGFVQTQGVRRAVDELSDKLPHCLRLHNLNGHGLLVKAR